MEFPKDYITQHAIEATFSRALHFPEGTLHRSVFWDENHAASKPRCYPGSADLSTRALLILTLGPWKAMEVAANCSLRVKRPLLDPRFEGYKLSLEPLPSYQLELDAGGKRRQPLTLCSVPLSVSFGATRRAFSSFLTSASQATVAFLTLKQSWGSPWLSSENDAHPRPPREPPSSGSGIAGPWVPWALLPGLREPARGTAEAPPAYRSWSDPCCRECSGQALLLEHPLCTLRSHTSLEDLLLSSG